MMNTTIGLTILTALGSFFEGLINISKAGINFVFGDIQNKNGFTFFLNVLLPLVFISVINSIFNYIKVLPFIIKYVGIAINKITNGALRKLFCYFNSNVWATRSIFNNKRYYSKIIGA